MTLLFYMFSALVLLSTEPLAEAAKSRISPFKIDLSHRVPHMVDMIKRTQLPSSDLDVAVNSRNDSTNTGISLSKLESLRSQWLHDFDWEKEQLELNRLKHFTTIIEGQTIHFIHEVSQARNSIPLILLHGWPGSFLEMLPVINNLTLKNNSHIASSDEVSFDVVIPSLPGFGFSSPTPKNWTIDDTARVFNTLMQEVLGYDTYAVHGSDWGAFIGWSLYNSYPNSVRATHMALFPELPLQPEQLNAENITLSREDAFSEQLWVDNSVGGSAYAVQQRTKPNTIGLALYDNPVGQLAWIAEKYISWSDPRRGTGPSVLNDHEILRVVSLYYLTESFTSAAYIYNQNPLSFAVPLSKARTGAPFLFSNFKYDTFFIPEQVIRPLTNLVYYKSWDFGGHFCGLDNPPALVQGLREIKKYWHY
ncbi:putative epoxide hydrolase [Trichoderma lentiforme]|uniref:Epoxide hydrolase n=1 Tax=Trichoderma lentiforme TaxID=1567552 RepID=A0A9P4XBL2_9HYPO|nr:putative epoxide hydrolase [Trichoderma lentiforme]